MRPGNSVERPKRIRIQEVNLVHRDSAERRGLDDSAERPKREVHIYVVTSRDIPVEWQA